MQPARRPRVARFLAAWGAPPVVLQLEAAAPLRWSSLPFRDLEPGWPAAVEWRLDLALERASGAPPVP